MPVFHHCSQCPHKVWLTLDENCRSSVSKFPAPYGPVLTKKIQSAIEFVIFGRSPKKVTAYISPWLWYFVSSLVKIWWKLLKELCFKYLESEIFAKCTEWPQTKLKESGIKSTLHICTITSRVPNFRPFCSTISHFRDIPHFRFPTDSHVKISKCYQILNFGRLPKKVIAYIPPWLSYLL